MTQHSMYTEKIWNSTQLLCLLVTDAVIKGPVIHLGEMGEAQCGGHSGLENFTSKESISLDYLLITDERIFF